MACSLSKATFKSILCFLGLLFWISAIILLAVSVYVMVEFKDLSLFLKSRSVIVPASIVVAAGVFFALAGSLGFCASCKDNKFVLFMFGFILLLLITLLISGAITGGVYKNRIKGEIKNRTWELMSEYDGFKNDSATKEIDFIQKQLHCCGFNNFTDWVTTKWGIEHGGAVPLSCCLAQSPDNVTCDGQIDTKAQRARINEQGCYEEVMEFMDTNLRYVVIAGVSFMVLLILGMLAACALLCRRSEGDLPYYNLNE